MRKDFEKKIRKAPFRETEGGLLLFAAAASEETGGIKRRSNIAWILAALFPAGAVKILAAEPAGMGEIRPECIAAIFGEHSTAAGLIAAATHLALTDYVVLQRVPLTVTVLGATTDGARMAAAKAFLTGFVVTAASH